MAIQDRRAREKANIREEILAAAQALFVKEGYEQVSIRKIADKIEYAPGTIYLHFKDKADIFRTICGQTFGRLHTRLAAIATDSCHPLEKLRRAGLFYVQFALDNPSHYMLLFLTRDPGLLSKDPEVQDMGEACFRDLCNIVEQCTQQDLLRSQDVHELSQAVWCCVHGVSALLIAKCEFPFIERGRLIDAVIETVLHGVLKPPSAL